MRSVLGHDPLIQKVEFMPSINKNVGLTNIVRVWSVQSAPYRKPLPFLSRTARQTQYPGTTGQVGDAMYSQVTAMFSQDVHSLTIATNAARSKLVNKLNEGQIAAIGLTIMDWRTSLNMITGALTSLASKRARARLYYDRKASDIYLEGIFGWLPMISDIYAAVQVLGTTYPVERVKGSGKATNSYTIKSTSTQAAVFTKASVRASAEFKVTNLNLALLNQLGLLNPASIAWDAVPYSFVLNWFLPVGQMLNSLTDFIGFEAQNAYYTAFTVKEASGMVLDTSRLPYKWAPRACSSVTTERKLGLPPYKLPPVSLPSVNLTKALIAFALFDKTREPPLLPRKRR